MAFPESVLLTDHFIGRVAELQSLERMYSASAAARSVIPPRLLTFTGVGGSGKTRLADQLVQRVQSEFTDGTLWLDLAPLADATQILRALLATLDVQEQPDEPPLETVIAALAPKQLLLILDNCEHLLEACALLTGALLSRCDELSILATSREPLSIPGQVIYQVQPLSLPAASSDENILASDAVTLFDVRAREVMPNFHLTAANISSVVRVCEQLDGLPLAIELAAARVQLMTVSEIAERLNNAFRLLTRSNTLSIPRHQTLRAAMDWSYDLLSESEQRLLQRVSIFAGGFTLEAAERVCGDDPDAPSSAEQTIPRDEILDLLANLANKSLVVIGERIEGLSTRYRMLETVRQYAAEKLAQSGESAVLQARHFEWCLAFAGRAAPELLGVEQGIWLKRLDAEHSNFRAALRHASEASATETGLRLANALFRYWDRRGDFAEARGWLETLLAGDPTHVAPGVRTKSLVCLASFHFRLGDLDGAMRLGESALELAHALDDRSDMATTLNLLGTIANEASRFDRAFEFHTAALSLRRELDDTWGISASLHNLGHVVQTRGYYRRSLEYYDASLALKRQLGDPTAVALALNNMGAVILELGEYSRAQLLLQESLALNRDMGDKQGTYYNFMNLGAAAFHQGDYLKAHEFFNQAGQAAVELGNKGDIAANWLSQGELAQAEGDAAAARVWYDKALGLEREVGDRVTIAQALNDLALNALYAGDLARAAGQQEESLKIYKEFDHKPGMAMGLEVFAGISAAQQEYARAAQFLGAASLLRAQTENLAHPHQRKLIDSVTAQARRALGAQGFTAAFELGFTLPIADTVAAALSASPPLQSDAHAPAQPALQIIGSGQSLVIRAAQPLTSADWTYAKSKELFFYLLTHPSATKAQIGLELWADASPAQLRRIFHRVLFALRQALGRNEWITYRDEVYALNRDIGYSYDIATFEAHLADARRFLRGEGAVRPQAIQPLQHAVALYQGDFLADMEGGDWILFRREELRKEFLQALLALGQLLSAQKEFAQAAAVYARALSEDNYLEVAHRELMRVWARQGEVSQALRHYQSLVTLLQAEFGAPPAPETRALYEHLRLGESV